jgi:hypothetical protein
MWHVHPAAMRELKVDEWPDSPPQCILSRPNHTSQMKKMPGTLIIAWAMMFPQMVPDF